MGLGLTVHEQLSLEATLAEFERLEALGVQTLWYAHAFGFDALGVLALAAVRTSRARLGTAVVPIYPRHPVLTAQAAQVAQAASGGRLVLGVGAGHRLHVTTHLGLRFDRPVTYAAEYVSVLRRLLAGEEVRFEGEHFQVEAQLPAREEVPPLILAAVGPNMLEAAGAVADGAITWLCDEIYLRTIAFPALARGAASADRDPPALYAGLPLCVHDDIAEARAAVDMWLAGHSDLESYRRALDRIATGRSPADVALIGDEDTVAGRIIALFDLGVKEVGVVPLPAGPDISSSLARSEALVAALASGR